MQRKHILIGTIVVLIIAAAGYTIYTTRLAGAEPAPDEDPTPVTQTVEVNADGYVVPARWANLSVAVPGVVATVHVSEGQVVAAGAPLLTLENAAQQAAVAVAQANLAQAGGSLARLTAGARPEEVLQAEAAVAAAQARYDRLAAGATPEQIAGAKQAVAVAQASLAAVQAGPSPEDVTAAEAQLKLAEADKEQAQSAYDRVAFEPRISSMPQSLALEHATIKYEKALADYQNVLNGARPEQVNVYRQQVRQAQAALDEVLAGARPEDLAAAQADVQAAQAALALIQAGARAEDVSVAQAQVDAARAALDQAQAALDLTVLAAPFSGTVSAVNVNPGEYVAPGVPAVRLGDLHAWQVQTDDLSELDVVRLAVGDRVTVTFDALPGQQVTGTVVSIRPAAELKRGDVTYTVMVAIEATELQLMWGMSAAISK